jgi:P27 family predicted phage terminase small subunit
MPAHVRKTPEARKFWRQHCHTLLELGRLEPEFRASFARLSMVHARVQEYTDMVAKDGAIIEGPRGGKQKHPLLTALRQAEATFTELAGKFGLDPKSAQRLPTPAQVASSRRARLLADNNYWTPFEKYNRATNRS